jgi:hypothetical protein
MREVSKGFGSKGGTEDGVAHRLLRTVGTGTERGVWQ